MMDVKPASQFALRQSGGFAKPPQPFAPMRVILAHGGIVREANKKVLHAANVLATIGPCK
jgi:hypothetical protein